MSLYTEQHAYQYLERIALALEKLSTAPVTGFSQATTAKVPQPTPNPASNAMPRPKVVVGSSVVPIPAVEPSPK